MWWNTLNQVFVISMQLFLTNLHGRYGRLLRTVFCKCCNVSLKEITVQYVMGCVFVFVLSAIKLVLGALWHESEHVPLNGTASHWIQLRASVGVSRPC